MRIILAIIIIIIGIQFIYSEGISHENIEKDYQVIPDEAIRLRILANSNSDEDQAVKNEVRDVVNKYITEWLEELTSIEDAREVIKDKLPTIEELVKQTVGDENFTVQFGEVEFPDKIYDNFIYPAGVYEAILITIGDGKGDNWWCVLFPPLCFVDFANGATVLDHDTEQEEEEQEVKIKFFYGNGLKR